MGAAKDKPMSEEQVRLLVEINKCEMIIEVNQAAVDRWIGPVPYFHKWALETAHDKLKKLKQIKEQKGW